MWHLDLLELHNIVIYTVILFVLIKRDKLIPIGSASKYCLRCYCGISKTFAFSTREYRSPPTLNCITYIFPETVCPKEVNAIKVHNIYQTSMTPVYAD